MPYFLEHFFCYFFNLSWRLIWINILWKCFSINARYSFKHCGKIKLYEPKERVLIFCYSNTNTLTPTPSHTRGHTLTHAPTHTHQHTPSPSPSRFIVGCLLTVLHCMFQVMTPVSTVWRRCSRLTARPMRSSSWNKPNMGE